MTFSRLTLGDPRLKSKLRGGEVSNEPPCSDKVVTGGQVLGDPGFENTLSNTGRLELPEPLGNPPDLVYPSDGTVAVTWEPGGSTSPYHWFAQQQLGRDSAGNDAYWVISDADPDTGTYHARVTLEEQGTSIVSAPHMHCNEDPASGIFELAWPVTPGLILTLSARMKATWTDNDPIFRVLMPGFDSELEFVEYVGGFGDETPSSSYTTYTRSAVVPSGIAFVQAFIQGSRIAFPDTSGMGDLTIDLDNVSFGIE